MTAGAAPCAVEWRGREPYTVTWEHQKALVARRTDGAIPDTLVFVEHEPVFTRGRKSRDLSNLKDTGTIPVVEVERGGDVTYHGPGQLVAYPIFALAPDERDAPRFIRRLESWLIAALDTLGVPGETRPGYAGVWTRPQADAPALKIASVGIGVTARWVTWHGVSLNVDVDLSAFARINPCGLDATVMTSLAAQGHPSSLDAVRSALRAAAPAALGRLPL